MMPCPEMILWPSASLQSASIALTERYTRSTQHCTSHSLPTIISVNQAYMQQAAVAGCCIASTAPSTQHVQQLAATHNNGAGTPTRPDQLASSWAGTCGACLATPADAQGWHRLAAYCLGLACSHDTAVGTFDNSQSQAHKVHTRTTS